MANRLLDGAAKPEAWISSPEQDHPAGFHPVLVLGVVEQRHKDSNAGQFTARY
jgi:hypothetical protein